MQCIKKKCISLSLFFAIGIYSRSAWTAENIDKGADDKEIKSAMFEYLFENRSDPFIPFISPPPDSPGPLPVIPPLRPFPPSALPFEPGQLQLVAVMSTSGGRMALAEDASGKGYILIKGRGIGHGIVTRIEVRRVIITETVTTRSGRTITKETVMRLKKEGDK